MEWLGFKEFSIDDVTINNERDHDTNSARFKELTEKYCVTLNVYKSVYRLTKI